MEKSKVYFTDFRVHHEESLTHKLQRLLDKAGLGNIDMDGKYVAIKMHFGELGNLAFLRPNWAKAVADYVKAHGGKPFLTDCNTLYVGSRKNALDHLSTAYENGFSPLSTGCHVIIADGIKGTDEALVPVKGDYVKEAKIGQAIMDADIIISLNHFKGHESTGFGGAIKDLGMGCGSRAGKMEMHAAGKPEVDQSLCIGCGFCQKNCAHDAITITNHKASINHDKCVGCGRCIGACPKDATHAGADNSQRNPQLQNGGIRPGGGAGPASVPHQPGAGYQPLLRLPRLQRRTHPAGYRHVCLRGRGGHRPGLRGRLPPGRAHSRHPAFRDAPHQRRPLHQQLSRFRVAQPALPRGKDRPGPAGL